MDLRLDLDPHGNITAQISLSRYNLYSLLAKLDGFPRDSLCTIAKDFPSGIPEFPSINLRIKAEEDTLHYQGRTPGMMHQETAERIQAERR